MYCDRRGNGQKPTRTKPPGQNPPRTVEIEFVQGTFVRDFCTRPTKNRGGSEMCDVLSGCVTKCDRGCGSKLAKNSVRYFMEGPLPSFSVCLYLSVFFSHHPHSHFLFLSFSLSLPLFRSCDRRLVRVPTTMPRAERMRRTSSISLAASVDRGRAST